MLKFEHHSEPVISSKQFLTRIMRQAFRASVLIILALAIGILGYHYFESLPWLDSLLNASMILGGMGPVDSITTTAGKIFASAYAIFCGLIFIGLIAILLVPVFHRLIHKFHATGKGR